MVSLYTLISLIPLLASAARMPHNLLDLDAAAAVVADAKADVGLNLVPRTNGPRPPTLPIPVTPPPIVPEVVGAVTGLLPQIDAGLSFCVTLAADAHLVADGQVLFIAAGVCLCADADVEVNPSPNGVTVVASSGLTVRGATAVKLRASIVRALHGLPTNGPNYFNLQVAAGVCLQLDLFVGFTQHDFSGSGGVDRCCARKCQAPYIPGPNNRCVCPQANMCGGQCLSGPALLCGGTCHLASDTVCQSGSPAPITPAVPRRRSEIPFGRCSYGQELCPVATSSGYECVNVQRDMESCGGCVHSFRGTGKQGQDCTAIPYINEVICNAGSCLVKSCQRGYKTANNGTICIAESRLDLESKQSIVVKLDGSAY